MKGHLRSQFTQQRTQSKKISAPFSIILFTLFAFLTSLTTSCKQKPVEAVPLHRFEQVLFGTPADQLPAKIASVRNEFSTDLLNLQPDNPDFMNLLIGFTEDPVMRDIYRIVDSVFGDMQPEARQLAISLDKAKSLYPTIRYDKVYTFISGAYDYNMRVGCNSHELIISLDQYILPYTAKYNYFNSPLYLIHQSDRKYLLTDCMAAIARQHIAIPSDREMSLLDYMVSEGKAIYFAQQTLPDAPDSILMRYTSEQTKLRNEELVRATRLVENADKQKTAFIQNLSHQIRTPLNILMGFAQILREAESSSDDKFIRESLTEEEKKSITDMMSRNAKHLRRMLLMLFDSSEIGLNEELKNLQLDKLSCNEVAQMAIYEVKRYFPDLSVNFKSNVPDDFSIHTCRIYLKRSLREILYNAATYSDGQHVSMYVEQKGDSICFIVEDKGKGITESNREDIFRFFTKVDDLSEGLGLGLPLAKRHAENLGGDLTLDTDYHEGCRFILELPLA